MNRLHDARERLAAALEPVMPGRVQPYPYSGRLVAPGVWVDGPTVMRATIGTRTQVAVATFPVWIVYDGADRAQVAGLDDVVSNVWDVAEATPGMEPTVARPAPLPADVDPNGRDRLRAVTVNVDVTIAATTLCVPDAQTSTIPPTPIRQEPANG